MSHLLARQKSSSSLRHKNSEPRLRYLAINSRGKPKALNTGLWPIQMQCSETPLTPGGPPGGPPNAKALTEVAEGGPNKFIGNQASTFSMSFSDTTSELSSLPSTNIDTAGL